MFRSRSVGWVVGLVVGVSAGLLLSALVVGVYAGLLLSALVVCLNWLFSLALLATARGGASFLCPKRQRNEAKKTLSKRRPISVHSVQFKYLGTRKVRCSPEPGMFETLLLRTRVLTRFATSD